MGRMKNNFADFIIAKQFFRHLIYPQVQKCLPPNLPRAQETFFRVVRNRNIKIILFLFIF
jgi:hypothetical protein